MDEYAEKRDMVQMLLKMLKSSASNEVSGGMKAPEGMPEDAHGVEIEKVSVMPGDKKDGMEMSPEDESMADQVMHKGEPMPEEMPKPDMEAAADMPAHDMDEDEDDAPMPAFASLMKRKLKK